MDEQVVKFLIESCKRFKGIAGKKDLFSQEMYPELTPEMVFVLVKNLERVFFQLETELRSDSALYLSDMNDVDGDHRSLLMDVEECLNSLSARSYGDTQYYLRRLVVYQMRNGFWHQQSTKAYSAIDKEAKKLFVSSSNIYEEIRRMMAELKDTKSQISNIGSSVQKSSSEAATRMAKLHSEATVKLNEIESIYSSARVYAEEVPRISSEASAVLSSLKLNFHEEENLISDMAVKRAEMLRANKDAQEKVEGALQVFSEKLDSAMLAHAAVEEAASFIKEKENYFNERNSYLDDLIGREVGSSLFETFKQRKNEISGSIGFWKWSVLVVTAATVLWVFFLFGGKDVSAMSWQLVLINTVKTMPVVGLLLFAISQYTKERNFQEEYAFKSAVALTINSYANQLDDKVNKDKMVMDSVNAIYRSPVSQGSERVSSKEVTSVIKDLSDAVKGLKG
ncbi:hypothetical protein [Pseudomonas peli]|uniref:hypothetical protein n=1 Tax=Pseudomonas peli TaxID=592361 RepID=UPI0024AD88F9|nr:hypothetical protein [Pseudomonas peli]